MLCSQHTLLTLRHNSRKLLNLLHRMFVVRKDTGPKLLVSSIVVCRSLLQRRLLIVLPCHPSIPELNIPRYHILKQQNGIRSSLVMSAEPCHLVLPPGFTKHRLLIVLSCHPAIPSFRPQTRLLGTRRSRVTERCPKRSHGRGG